MINQNREQARFTPALMTIDQILDGLTPQIRSNPRIWSSALLELIAVLASRNMEKQGLPPVKAAELAQDVIVFISHYLGGRAVYLPAGARLAAVVDQIASLRLNRVPDHREKFLASCKESENKTWPVILIELFDVLVNFFQNLTNLDFSGSVKRTGDTITAIARHCGGRAVYMPRDDKIRLAIRDRAIFKAFDAGDSPCHKGECG